MQLTTDGSVGNVAVDGTVTMIDDATSLTHTGATSLTISSSQAAAFVKIQGGSAAYVQVESVKITDDQIGTVSDANLITLEDDKMSLDGALDLTNEDATITHTGSSGTPTLTISSTSGPVSVVSDAQYVDVESVRFTGDQIGLDGDTAIMQLTTANSVGNVAVDGTVTIIDDATSLTHTGATSLTISSSQAAAFVKIQGGSAAYVQVESVKITDDQIGTVNDANLITLEDDKMSLDGALDLTVDAATITHTGATSLTMSSTSGPVSVVSTAQYVDVESVRFTGDKIGLDGDTAIMQLTTAGSVGNVAVDGTVTMIDDATSLTHTGTTSLAISSTNGHITIAGGSDDYVDVESVRFTGDQIGLDGDTAIMQLTTDGSVGNVAIDGTVTMIDDATSLTHTGTTSLAISSTNGHITIAGGSDDYVDVESVRFTGDKIGLDGDTAIMQLTTAGSIGKVTIDGTVEMIDDTTSLTHTGTTSLAISSTNGHVTIAGGADDYVDVESVRFTDAAIGTTGDADLVTLEDNKVTIKGTLTTTDDILMSEETAALTHDSDTGVGLAITSTNGYVDVEQVRFTDDQIGLAGTEGLVTLSSSGVDIAGSLDTDGHFKVADTKFTIDVSGNTYADGTLGVKGLSTLQNNLELSKTDAAIKHTGTGATTGLTISSDNGYVDVESVRFTDATIGTTDDPGLISLTDTDVTVTGTLTVSDNVKLTEDNAVIEHTSTASGASLTIKSNSGYVDVESVRFTGDKIGLDSDTAIMQLTTDGSVGNVAVDGTVTMIDDATSLTHTGATSLTISSSQAAAFVKIQGGSAAYVQVESVKITDDQIGTVNDANLITLEDDKMSLDGALDLTNEDATITHTGSSGTPTLTISSTNGPVSVVSDAQYVDVESVRFTGDQIGLSGDTAIMQLTTAGSIGNVAIDGTVTMIDDATSLTHTGTTSLAISSTNGHITIAGGSDDYVDVESVRFTGDKIGLDSDTAIMQLTTAGSIGNVAIDGTVTMIDDATSLTHTGTTSLAISSTNGHITIAGGSDDYVDVESVRFTNDYIGISTDTDIIQLTSTGSQATVAIVADVDVTGTMDVSSNFEIGTNKFKVVEQTGAVSMISDAQTITHDGATSLTISSSQAAAFVKIQGGSAAYVQVESVKITDNQIGTVSDANLITLEDDKMSLDGALDLKNEDATITHTASTGTPTLTISSTNGPVSVVSDAQYVDIESVRFTGDKIGLDGDTAIMQLTTDGSVGNVAVDGTVTMIDDVTSLTHTGATSLAISSTNGHITIAGGSNDYVDIESVRFTGDKIGLDGDTAIMQLTTAGSVGNVAIDGTVTMIDDATSLTHTGTTSLAISSTNGHITIAGGSDDYVDVESVRFTNDYIGISTDTDIIQLTSTGSQATVAIVADVDVTGTMDVSSNFEIGTDKFKVVEQTGAVSMISDAQTITHDGATSLTISSSQAAAFVKIQGGSAAYVQVESVKITDDQIGTVSDANLITLEDDKMSLDGALDLTNEDATITHTASTGTPTLTISSTNGPVSVVSDAQYVDIESVRFTGDKIGLDGDTAIMQLTTDGSVGNVAVDGTVTMIDDATSLTHTGATSLTISSSQAAAFVKIQGGSAAYVQVESVKITDDQIGTVSDANLITLEDDKMSLDGALDLTNEDATITHTASTGTPMLTISSTNGPVSVVSDAQYVDIESVRFTGDKIGLDGDTAIMQLTTDGSVGNVAVDGTVTMIDDATSLTHTGATSLTISSSQAAAFVKIQGGSAAYVQVESVKITDDQIGTVNDADLITLEDDKMSLDGALDLTVDAATITHTGATSLTMSSTSGPVSVVSDAQYVDVESVRFTGDMIGLSGDTAIMQLTTAGSIGKVKIDGTVEMIDDTTSLTHTGTTSLAISSTNGHITIAGGADDYVDVESVRFTGDKIGLGTDTAIMQLTTAGSVGNVAIDGTVTMIDDVTSLTHTGATSLAISSTNGHITIAGGSNDYVDVESVRITDAAIGTTGDADLITLEDNKVTIKGSLDTDGYIYVAATKFTVDTSGNTYADGTFEVKGVSTLTGAASLSSTLDVNGATSLGSTLSVTGASTLTGAATLLSSLNVSGATALSNTLSVALDATMKSDIIMSDTSATLKHSASSGGLTITSENGYVDVEEVRFTNKKIGINSDADLISLKLGGVTIAGTLDTTGDLKVADTMFVVDAGSGNTLVAGTLGVSSATTLSDSLDVTGVTTLSNTLTVANATTLQSTLDVAGYIKVNANKFTVDVSGNTYVDGTLRVKGVSTLQDDLVLSEDDAKITHTASTGGLTISSTNAHVDVESVRFTGGQIGTTDDPGLISLTDTDVTVTGTLTVSDNVKLTEDNAVIEHTSTASGASLTIKSNSGYVDVESVRFTGDQIGLDGDTAIMQLTTDGSVGNVAVDGTVTMIDDATSLTHTGATSLTISSSQAAAFVKIQGGSAAYVQVESVKITDNQIGTVNDANLITLEDDKMSLDGALDLTNEDATITHTASTGTPTLTISSTSGPVSVVSTAQYVEVESVRFTGDQIGLDGDTAIMQLTTANSVGNVAVDGTVTMIDDATSLTHTGATSLTISSSQAAAFVKIQGGSAAYVQVESVKITDNQIGTVSDANLVTLEDDKMSLDGALDLTNEDATITHTASTGTPMLTISSTSGPVSVVSTAQYVDIESVRFTGDQIGLDGDTAIIQLTTANSVGNVAVDGTVTMIDDATSLTHTGATSLTISSSQAAAFVKIQGGSAAYVQVESVKITDDQIGTVNDADLITLEDDKMSLDGALDLKNEDATITHTASTGTPTLTISSTNGPVSVVSDAQYVDVESVRFTGDQIGLDGDTAIMQLTTAGSVGNVAIDGTVTMIDDVTSLTHTGTTSLAISSTNGHITIAGGSDDYVDVESVRFTNDYIGISTDTDIIQLTSTGSQATVAIVADVDVTGTMDVSSDFEIGTDKFKVVEQTGAVSMISDAQTITHDGATSLTISSSQAAAFVKIEGGSAAYVQVESVKITDNQIGTVSDANLITLEDDKMSLDGALDLKNEDATITHTASTGTPTLTISSTNGPVSVVSDAQYVDIESVRFTGDKIGLDGDTAIMQLTTAGSVGNVAIDGTVTMIDDATSLTHTGATSLAISSTNGHITIAGGSNDYVDIESVRFTNDYIGISTDTDIIQLTSTGSQATVAIVADVDVTGTMDVSSDFAIGTDKFKVVEQTGAVSMISDAQTITHDGATSLTISSSQAAAFVKIEGGSAAYVQVESVKITDNQIGTVSDANLITLEDDKMSLDGALDLKNEDATITHTASTGTPTLTISSTNGPVSVVSNAQYVDVESVRFTGDKIGLDGDTAIMQLTTAGSIGKVTIDGTVEMIDDTTSLTHTGTTSLAISSTNGHVTIAGGADDYVDVESVRFTDAAIGTTGDADLVTLEDNKVTIKGTLTTTDDILMSEETAALTHDSDTGVGLAITSTNGYVDVEQVRFTDDQIGLAGTEGLVTLSSSGVDIAGSLDTDGHFKVADTKFTIDVSGNTYADGTLGVKGLSTLQNNLELSKTDAAIKHTGTGATTGLTISSDNGYVDVESVRFTDATIGTTDDPGLISLTDTDVTVTGTLTVSDNVKLTEDNAVIEHTSTASGASLTIKSNSGYVDVESVRFTGDQIGLDSDTAIMQLTTDGSVGNVAVDGTVTMIDDATSLTHTGATSLTISSSQAAAFVKIQGGSAAYVQVESVKITDNQIGTVNDANLITLEDDKMSLDGALDLKNEDATITHTASTGTPTLTISSTSGPVSVVSTAQYVEVESVRFTGDQIGLDGDTAIMQLTTANSVGNVAVDGTVTMIDDATSLTHTGATSLTISSSQAAAFVKIQGGSAAYVQVESVKITDDQIGTVSDANLITLEDDKMSLDGALDLKNEDATITHTASTGTPMLTISSTNGPVSVVSNAQYVEVESVRFTGDQIGLDSDTAIMQLTTDGSVGNVAIDGTVTMIDDVTSLTHTGATSLAISSTNGHITIAGGSNDYVDVESVRFTGDQIGLDGDTAIMQLTTANSVGNVAIDGTVTMIDDVTSLTHTGTTSLAISSTNGHITIAGGSDDYVDVESVRFTNDYIGISTDTDIIQLTSTGSQATVAIVADVDVTGTMDVSSDFEIGTDKFKVVEQTGAVSMISDAQTITHDGATSLTISSSQAAAFVKIEGGSAAYVQVESVKITDNQIGTVSDANLITLEDDKMSLDGALDLKNEDATITHTASTGTPTLTISSTNGPVSVVSDAQYVDIESVRFTGDKIGLDGDTAIMQLTTDGSVGNVAIDGTVTMIDDVTSLTHTGATSLAISSTNGHITIAGGSNDYVDIESVRFTGDKIGLDGDTAIMQLTTAGSVGNVAIDGTVTMIDDATSLTHTGATSLAISSTNGHITIAGGSNDYVDIESVRFTNDYIGISTDTDIIQLTSTGSQATVAIVADVDVTGTMDVSSDFAIGTDKFKVVEQTGAVSMISDAQTITHDGATSLTISSSQAAAFVKIEGGSAAYVQVESVKITDDQIGTVSDANLITLEDDKMSLDGALDLKNEDATITHTASTGTPTLTISSTNGPVSVVSDAQYVDVESVRFTGDKIGLDGDTAIMQLTTAGSVGNVAIDGTVTMIDDATSLTHTGATSLAISSTNGHITIAGGSNDYVDIESVRFTNDYIGISTDTDIIQLTSTGSQATVAIVADVDVTGTMDVSSDFEIGTDKFKVVEQTGAVSMISDAQTITHDGATSLTISSSQAAAFVKIEGGSAAYVQVESVKITDNQIGTVSDANLITLEDDKMSLDGALDLKNEDATITHTASTGTPTLTISSTNGPVSVVSNAQYVDVELVRFTGDQIGLDGDTAIIQLTTDGSVGNVAVDGTVTMIDDATSLTHTGATSLTISSSQAAAFVKIQGGSAAYVQVESVKITDNQIGTVSDANLITLEDDKMSLDGALDLKNEDATITHTASTGTPTLTISSTNGPVSVVSDAQYVDVESVRFTGDQIGSTGDPDLITLTNNNIKLAGTVEMSVNSAALTHSGTTSLAISSTNGYVTIAGGSGATDYVDVESVRFTNDYIGISGDTDIIQLTSTGSQATVAIVADVDVTGTMDVSSDFAIGTDKFKVVEQTGAVSMSSAAQTITHDGATSLTISSSQAAAFVKIEGGSAAYVQVESVKITDNQIGTVSDANLITLEDDKMSLDGALDLTNEDATITHTASTGTPTLTISSTNGPVSVVSNAQYVDVELVRFTDSKIGTTNDADLITLADDAVTVAGVLQVSDDFKLSEISAAITHTAGTVGATTGLTISSTAGFVDVESVRFTDDPIGNPKIGTTNDADLITLSDNAVELAGTLTVTDDLKLSKATAALTHTASTGGLAITSNDGYVDVESVRFTETKIGITGDTDIITLSSASVAVAGALGSTGDFNVATTAFTVAALSGDTAVGGTLSVTGASTLTGAASLSSTLDVGGATTLTSSLDVGSDFKVAGTKFTVDSNSGDTVIAGTLEVQGATVTLSSSLGLNGAATISDDITMTKQIAAITHNQATGGLAITSTYGYVDVESLRVTGNVIGLSTDVEIITLADGAVAIDGTLDTTGDFKIANTKFTVDSVSGNTAVAGTLNVTGAASLSKTLAVTQAATLSSTLDVAGNLKVAQTKFTVDSGTGNTYIAGNLEVQGTTEWSGDFIVSGSASIPGTLSVGGISTFADDILMTETTAALTHNAATGGLAITSSSGYVDVESVRFTGNIIGLDGDFDIITLQNAAVTIDGSLSASGDFKIATTMFTVDANSGDASVYGGLTAGGAATVGGTLDVTGGVTLGNSLSVTGSATLGSSLGVSGDFKVATDKFTVDTSGNVEVAGTLDVTSDTTLTGALDLTGAATLRNDITMTKTDATLTHTPSSGGLTLQSTYGYVAVEDVRFTGNVIGISTDSDIITLTNAAAEVDGALSASGDFSIATTAFTVASSSGDTSIGGALDVTAATTLQDSLTVSGVTTVSNTLTVTQGASLLGTLNVGGTFSVATTKFTVDASNGDTVTMGSLNVGAAATLDSTLSLNGVATLANDISMSKTAAKLTHTASQSLTSGLTISSEDGFVDIEQVRFNANEIGVAGDTDLITLSSGAVVVAATLSSTDDFSVGSPATFTVDAQTGNTDATGYLKASGPTTLSNTLTVTGAATLSDDLQVDGATTMSGTVTAGGDFKVITSGSEMFAVVASSGDTTVAGTLSVTQATNLDSTLQVAQGTTLSSTLAVDGAATMKDNILMEKASAAITHNYASGGLDITSDNGYVGVEDVRFTGSNIGTSADDDLITIAAGSVTIRGTLDTTGATTGIRVATDKFTVDAAGNTAAEGTLGVTGVTTLGSTLTVSGATTLSSGLDVTGTSTLTGSLEVTGTTTLGNDISLDKTDAVITHTATTSDTTGLTIKSTYGYVQIEDMRFTGKKLGIAADTDLITLADGSVTIAGTVSATDDFSVGSSLFTVDAQTGNTAATGTLGVTGATTLTSTLGVGGATTLSNTLTVAQGATLSNTLNVALDATLQKNLIMSDTAAALTHSGTTGGLTIKSTNGYVDVEDMRFTDKKLGISTDPDLITLSAGAMTVAGTLSATDDFSVATTKFTVDAQTGDTKVEGTFDVTGATTLGHTLGVTGATTLLSTLDVSGTFKVSTKFTVDSGSGNTDVDGTLGVTAATTLSSTLSVQSDATLKNSLLMSKAAAAITHTASSGGLIISSTAGYVNVEDIRFTGATIGTSGDPDLISLADGHATVTGKLTANDDFSVATTGKFTVTAATGDTSVGGTLDVTAATTLSDTLTVTQGATLSDTLNVALDATLQKNLIMSDTAATLRHSAATGGLTITSASGYVDVESVRFKEKFIGISSDDNLIGLESGAMTVAGTLSLDDDFSVATTKFTVDAQTGDTAVFGTFDVTGEATLSDTLTVAQGATLSSTLNVAGVATMQNGVIMSAADASLTHSGNTGLKIKSTLAHVDVEDIRFSGTQIGISSDDNLISLASGAVTVAGTLSLDDDFRVATTKFTVDAQTGDTAVSGTFGVTGEATLSDTLTVNQGATLSSTLNVAGVATMQNDIVMEETAASLTHTAPSGSTSGLTIKSTYGFVDVESVRFTGAKIGVGADIDLLSLASGALTVAGTLESNGDLTVSSTNFKVTAATGDTSVGGTLDVTAATTLADTLTVTQGTTLSNTLDVALDATLQKNLIMSDTAATLRHTAASGGLTITSASGYVDVESVRFTGNTFGTTTDSDLVSLADDAVTITGTLDTTADFRVATDKFTVDASGNTAAAGTLGVSGATSLSDTLTVFQDTTLKTDLLMSSATAALTHTATTGGLTIKSTSRYVDVESIRFTAAKIGIAADDDLVNLANGAVTISGTLDATGTFKVATNMFSVDSGSGNTAVAGTLGVDGATTLSDTLNVAEDMTLQKNIIMSDTAAALTHSGASGGLTISSSNANGHVDVQSVRFTAGGKMGISTDDDIITLSSGAVAVAGTLTVSDDVKLSETSAALTHTAVKRRPRDYQRSRIRGC